jgi:hypothetical protein
MVNRDTEYSERSATRPTTVARYPLARVKSALCAAV